MDMCMLNIPSILHVPKLKLKLQYRIREDDQKALK